MTLEEKIEKAVKMLSMDSDIIEIVKGIESKLETTQNHYGDYMAALGQFQKQGKVMLHIMARSFIGAGANAQGVNSAMGILTGGSFR